MKIKGIDVTANVAWSPRHQYPIYLAAGTAAQQLDASFSTSAALEVYALNLNDPGSDMGLKSSTESKHRFHKVTWGTYGDSAGTVVGGCDGGVIQIYNATRLLNGESKAVTEHKKHTGPVKALDFNSFQSNLLASGASESEIYIWDLNNAATPMTPGSKSQPLEDITSIEWNKKFEHVLASLFPTRCVVWDLRKNDPVIKLTDNTSRTRWSVVAWNPDIATQLCLASEEDQNPVIQFWDLRFATAPIKILENHQRGVLSISWCHQDTDMLLSCSKDNRILCWNPNSVQPGTEVICEITSPNQWNFDVSWCPRNPALFATSSFDGHVSVYSVVGGPQQVQTTNKIADSFPGMELYSQTPVPQSHQIPVELRKPPKWLRKPVGATFGFGGKLVTFEQCSQPNNEARPSRLVHISQVVTAPQLVQRSARLETALQNEEYSDFCRTKVAQSNTSHERAVWEFLAARFDPAPRLQFLNLLGFQADEVNGKLAKFLGKPANARNSQIHQLSDRIATLGRSTDSESEVEGCDDIRNGRNERHEGPDGGEPSEDLIPQPDKGASKFTILTGDDTDGLICQALLLGNTEAAVELCLQDNRWADAIVIAMTGGSDLLAKTQYRYLEQSTGYLSTLISALVTEDWSQVIQQCDTESWKEALAAAMTHTSDQELPVLCEVLGQRLEAEGLAQNAQLCYICAGNLDKLISSWLAQEAPSSASTPTALQDVVELVMILKKALELQGTEVRISGRLADLLSNYAGLLASQGSMEAALSYLGASDEEAVNELRNRLIWSLGRNQKVHVQAPAPQRRQSSHSLRQRTLSSGTYPQSNLYEPSLSTPQPTHNFNLNPTAPLPAAAVPQQVPTRVFPSASPGLGSGGLTSRSKHVLDPSVQSAPSHQLYSQPVQPVQTAPTYGLPSTGYPSEVFNPPVNPTPPPPPPPTMSTPSGVSAAQPPGWNDPPVVASSRSVQPKPEFVQQTPITHPLLGAQPVEQAVNGHSAPHMDPYLAQQQQFPPPIQGFQQHQPFQPLNQGLQQQSPLPPLGQGLQHQQFPPPSLSMQQQQFPPQSQSLHQPFSQPNQGFQQQPPIPPLGQNLQQQQQYPPLNQGFQQYPGQGLQQHQFSQLPPQGQNMQNIQNIQQRAPTPVKAPPPEIVKKPIPEDHVELQSVLDELRAQCTLAANSPQSKRKLEEVAKKLDALYDNLREGRLSSNTLQGLHAIVQHIQAGDYPSGLSLHTQLVSGPDFSQIASFMPGIKVLLQSALQLQVYL